jgi:hypothetical protein
LIAEQQAALERATEERDYAADFQKDAIKNLDRPLSQGKLRQLIEN